MRRNLLRAIARRDTATIMHAVAPGIGLGFGGDTGIASFRRNLDSPEFWAALRETLANGGELFSDSTFYGPYWTTCRSPIDAYEAYVVIGQAVRARSSPDPNSAVLASLSYDFVAQDRSAQDVPSGWVAVRLASGQKAFVLSRYLKSPIDCRISIHRRGSRWLLVGYFCGD
jgi:hypothetical protein